MLNFSYQGQQRHFLLNHEISLTDIYRINDLYEELKTITHKLQGFLSRLSQCQTLSHRTQIIGQINSDLGHLGIVYSHLEQIINHLHIVPMDIAFQTKLREIEKLMIDVKEKICNTLKQKTR